MSTTPSVDEVQKSEGSPAPSVVDNKQQDGSGPALPRVSIFNLPQGITSKDDLLTLCKTYGQVVDAEFFAAKPNKAAFGFVTFKTKEDAEFAIYRLDKTTLGGKQPVKAQFAQDRPKREFVAGQGQPKKPKVKKPITPLTVFTPKNLATNAQNQNADPLNGKAGWDLNKTQQAQTQQNQQQNKGPRNQKNANHTNNGGQAQAQPGVQKQNNQGKGKAPAGTTQAPAAQNTQPAVQNQGNQNQGQNQGQQAAGKKKQQRGPKGANQPGQTGQPAPQGNQQRQNQGQAAPQVQANTTPAAPAAQNQNQQQGTAQNQPQNQQQQGQNAKKRNKKKKNPETQIRYRVNVVDPKNNLSLHVIELNQGQYDKFILPLVTKH
jgi:hypothetical protein